MDPLECLDILQISLFQLKLENTEFHMHIYPYEEIYHKLHYLLHQHIVMFKRYVTSFKDYFKLLKFFFMMKELITILLYEILLPLL